MTAIPRSQLKGTLLWLLIAASAISGVIYALGLPPRTEQPIDIAFGIAISCVIFLWYCADAHERNYRRSVLLNVCVVFLYVVALPYYFFRSRGLRGGFAAVSKSFLFVILMWAVTVCAGVATIFALRA